MRKVTLMILTLLFTVYFTCVLYEAEVSFFMWTEEVRHTASIATGILTGILLWAWIISKRDGNG